MRQLEEQLAAEGFGCVVGVIIYTQGKEKVVVVVVQYAVRALCHTP